MAEITERGVRYTSQTWTPEEYASIEAAALDEGLTVATWIFKTVLEKAREGKGR